VLRCLETSWSSSGDKSQLIVANPHFVIALHSP
jgi:hypothetical protein